ncbi:MAG: endonuclease domain-containing protein [Sphingomonas sp.]
MMNVSRASEMRGVECSFSSPLVGEEGARAANPRGKVRGNADGLTKRQLLPSTTTARARRLRRDRTGAEDVLWHALRRAFPGAKFRFQVPMGPFFADFCSHSAKLIIEADGGQHAIDRAGDAARTRFLEGEGYHVIRFWNNDILENIDGVIEAVATHLAPSLANEDAVSSGIGGERRP